jgi:hypothetical protein
VVENEGPRPLFRTKLARKRAAWRGGTIGDRIRVLEEPWSTLTLEDEEHRAALAASIASLELDVLIAGPVTRLGMRDAGMLAETADFHAARCGHSPHLRPTGHRCARSP